MPDHLKLRKNFTDEFSLGENLNPLYVGLNNIGGEGRLLHIFSRAWVRHFIHSHGGKIEDEASPMLLPVYTNLGGDIPASGSTANSSYVVPVLQTFKLSVKFFDNGGPSATAGSPFIWMTRPANATHAPPTLFTTEVQLWRDVLEQAAVVAVEGREAQSYEAAKDPVGTPGTPNIAIGAPGHAYPSADYQPAVPVRAEVAYRKAEDAKDKVFAHRAYLSPDELADKMFDLFSWLRMHHAYPYSYTMSRQMTVDKDVYGERVFYPTSKVRIADQPLEFHVKNALTVRNVTEGDTNGTSMVHWDNNPLVGRLMSFSNATPVLKDGIYGDTIPRSAKLDQLSRFEDPHVFATTSVTSQGGYAFNKIGRYPSVGEDIRSAGVISCTRLQNGSIVQVTEDAPQYLTEIPRKPGDIWSNYRGSETFALAPGAKKTVSMDFNFSGTMRKFFYGFTFANHLTDDFMGVVTQAVPASGTLGQAGYVPAKPAFVSHPIPELSWRSTPKFGSSSLLCFDRKNGTNQRFLNDNPASIRIRDRPIDVQCVKKTSYDCKFGTPPTNSLLAAVPHNERTRYFTKYEYSDFNQILSAIHNGVPIAKPEGTTDMDWAGTIRHATAVADGKMIPAMDNEELRSAKRRKTGAIQYIAEQGSRIAAMTGNAANSMYTHVWEFTDDQGVTRSTSYQRDAQSALKAFKDAAYEQGSTVATGALVATTGMVATYSVKKFKEMTGNR
jgi:hypothetical protein